MRAFAILTSVLACSCGTASSAPDGGPTPPVDFTIGAISFHISSGAAQIRGSVVVLTLSDQLDTCAALAFTPVGRATMLSLKVAAATDGTNRATVVAPKLAPAPGEAVGAIVRATGGREDARADAVSGSVAWTLDSAGAATVTSIDVGFAGTSDRLTTHGLNLPHCP